MNLELVIDFHLVLGISNTVFIPHVLTVSKKTFSITAPSK